MDKKIGRSISFNKEVILAESIKFFWEKEYFATSIQDIVDVTKLNSPSLYATFKNKENLYKQSILKYINDDNCSPIIAFEEQKEIKKTVKAFMQASLDYSTNQPKGRLGCFMTNCVSSSAGFVEGVQELLKEANLTADNKIVKCFEKEKEKGVLPYDFPSMKRARLMFDLA